MGVTTVAVELVDRKKITEKVHCYQRCKVAW